MTDGLTIAGLLERWLGDEEFAERIVHVETVEPAAAIHGDLDPALPGAVADRMADLGIDRLYRHQAEAVASVRRGEHTVVVASTASGKSLCYQLPIAEAAVTDPGATAFLVYPTKALAQDQLRALRTLGSKELVPAVYDGDTDREDRVWIRRHANAILTNPDMLHVGILPNHGLWKHTLSRLRYVVVDELHVLRGVFGSHVAHILRRLRRLAHHHGSDPTFVFTSATIGNPGELAERLIGEPVTVVDRDASPSGRSTVVLWNPELEDEATGLRASPLTDATRVFAELVRAELHTIVFSRSRKASELMLRWTRERLDPELHERIASYRAGYTAADRRRIEQALFGGELLGVTATNALELGIDVGGMDAAVITAFPGTIASFRQQAGRAGRRLDDSLAVLVAGQDALDQYYMTHPDQLFSRTPETAVVNPANPEILAAQVGCAAAEIPLVPDDRRWFGDDLEETATSLVADGRLRLRRDRLHWARRRPPAPSVDIRTSGGAPYTIVTTGGDLLGTVDEERAFSQCHPGAVYLHQGDTYVVEDLDTARREVTCRAGDIGYYTQPKIDKMLWVEHTESFGTAGRLSTAHGTVEVETRVVGYQRKEIRGGSVIDTTPLDLPPRRFTTQAVWVEVPDDVLDDAGIGDRDLPGVLHAAEHTAIAVLPLYAICDRWDVGGLSTAAHPDTGGPVWFIYDGYPGGAGIAPVAFAAAGRHLVATLDVLVECPCLDGCPSCVQSPKCGNFNEPLDKHGARALLAVALDC